MTIEELNKQIKSGRLQSVYFLYGEEQYLIAHKIKQIEEKILAPGLEDFNRFSFDGKKQDVEAVIEAIDQFPQMSEKKLVLVKNSGFFNQMTSREYKRIKEAIEGIGDDTCLIFTEEQFDKKKEKNLTYLNQYGGVVRFDYLPVNRLEQWVEKRINKEDKQIFPKDISYLVRISGPSLARMETEIQKLLNYMGERGKINREDIDAVVTQTTECRVYDMLDYMMAGQRGKAAELMKYLKDTKEQPTVVLGIMMGKLSELLLCKLLKENGVPANEMVDYFDFRRPLFAVNKTIDESKRYTEGYLKQMIQLGLEYDMKLKSGQMEGWLAAELYLAELMNRTEANRR